MKEYTEIIPYELADKIYKLDSSLFEPSNPLKKKPTYADALDWLKSKGIVIDFIPFYTFSFEDRIGYTWEIYWVDNKNAKMNKMTEQECWSSDKGYGGSFYSTFEAAILKALETCR